MRLLILSVLLLQCANSYKILVYIPKFAISHINFLGKLADTLVEAGHDVTALISEMDANLPDGTRKARIIRIPPAEAANEMNTQYEDKNVDIFDVDFDSYSAMVQNARLNSVSFCVQCRALLRTSGLVDQLKNERYDAMITESFENCGIVSRRFLPLCNLSRLSHLISPRALISAYSTYIFDPSDFGLHYSAITEHSTLSDGRFFHASLWARIKSIYHWWVLGPEFMSTLNNPLQKVFDDEFPGNPSFSSLLADAAVVFTNTEPLMGFARPTLSKMVPIGGICLSEPKKLDDYWHGLLSLRPQTVLVSFGSLAKSSLMKPSRKAALLKAFAAFPNTTFIWKYENASDDFATLEVSKHPNVVLTEWMPQTDILADPRLTLFISHAGMASCHELAHFGVPALLVPVFGDQVHNAGALAHIGIAQVFSKFDTVNAEMLEDAIGDMIRDKSYKNTALRIRNQLAARPTSPAERLVKNVEFAARFGPSKSLRPYNLELSAFQFLGLDIIIFLLGCIIIFFFFIRSVYILVQAFLSVVRSEKSQKMD